MSELTRLFNDFDRGRISRRHLMQALGIALAIRPVAAFAQGQCGGARASTPGCNPTPAKAPFASTGWKTVLLDHFSMQVGDYQKEAAYFAALMNWKVRSDDGTKAVLDIGDWGGIEIRGGYQPPAPANPPPANPPAAGAAGAAGAGGGRGGGGGRAPRMAIFDGFCWGIEPWDTKKVEAELKTRGLDPVADHNAKENFYSFRVKDPGGFNLQISNGSKKNRRTTPATGKVSAPPPFESTNWKTVWLDHISYEVADYKKNVAFYEALLGWKPGNDEGSQNQVQAGDIGGLIIRGGNSLDPNFGRGRAGADGTPGPVQPLRATGIGHISFGISPWDTETVGAELDKRGLTARVDTGGNGNTRDVMKTAKYQSYHTTTPNGFDLQISFVTKENRNA